MTDFRMGLHVKSNTTSLTVAKGNFSIAYIGWRHVSGWKRLQIPFRGYTRASLFSVIQSKRHQGARSNHRWHSFHSPSRRRLPSSPSFSGVANSSYLLRHHQRKLASVPLRNTAKQTRWKRTGHSMETTLTINIPPPERIRAAKGERLREKQKEKDKIQVEAVQGLPGRIKDREKEDETVVKEEERVTKDDREREREKLDRERRALAERGTTYKDKFQKMREKYDRVTSTHETHIQELDILNEKVKKLQAEHDLLLDAVFLADTAFYDHHFPSGPGIGPPPIGHPGPQQHPPQPLGMSPSSHSYYPSKTAHGHGTYAQHPNDIPFGGPEPFSTSRFLDNPAASSSGPSPKPGHNYYHQQSHGQNVDLQEQSHPFYGYPSREPMVPDSIHSPAHYRHSQHSTYRHYVHPSDHHGMPPPPPPIPGSDSERERQREKEWERERARREWEWEREREREGRHPPYKELSGLPPTPPLGPVVGLPPPSNGYNSMTSNGHGYLHGPEYGHSGHSLPPPPSVARTHARHSSRASRSNPSRSASRRRNEGMKMEMDVDADMPLPLPDIDRSLGGPIHLDMNQEDARKREHNRSAEQDHVWRESSMSGGRRSRRSSESRKPALGRTRTPPMRILEPEHLQPGLEIRHDDRRQSPRRDRGRDDYGYDRGDPARQFGHATAYRASYEDGSAHPSGIHSWRAEDSDSDDYEQRRVDYEYEQVRRHHRGGKWDVPGGRIENSSVLDRGIERAREEEEESDPGEKKVGKREVMEVDEAN